MAITRKCMLCGTESKFCPSCGNKQPDQPWKMVFHDEKCLAISEVWLAYRGKQISKEEARERISKYPENLELILKNDSLAANEIKAIFDVQKADNKISDNTIEESEEIIESNSESIVENDKTDVFDVDTSKEMEEKHVYKNNKYNKKKY